MRRMFVKIKKSISIALCALLMSQGMPSIDALANDAKQEAEVSIVSTTEESEIEYTDSEVGSMGLSDVTFEIVEPDEEVLAEHEALVQAELGDYEDVEELSIQASEQSYWRKLGANYIYDQLSEQDKATWDELCAICENSITNGKKITSITTPTPLRGKSFDQIKTFAVLFCRSNPQYFFLETSFGGYSLGDGYYLYINVYSDFQDGTKRLEAANEFKSKIDGWMAEINKKSLPAEKEKVAVDIICKNVVYENNSLAQSAYSSVCLGKTVCTGYASLFSILMNGVGVPTQTVTGSAYNGSITGPHAWSTVNLYGEWYVTDVTWMDRTSGVWKYSVYNRADSTIGGNRVLDSYYDGLYHAAKYDNGSSLYSYVDPYFTVGDYLYFIVNTNTACGSLLARPVAAYGSATASGVPKSVTYNSKTYTVTGSLDSSAQHLDPITYTLGISKSTLTVAVGDSTKLTVSYTPSKTVSGITWKSSNTAVATVDASGNVKGIKDGTATITATDGTSSVTCKVTVATHVHNYTTKKFTWNETNKTCTITYICSENSSHTVTYDCTITSQLRKNATCVAKGTTRYFAKYGNDSTSVDYDDLPIDKNAHGTTSLVGAKAATATADGYTGDKVCSLCNAIVEKGATIPRSGSVVTISASTWTGCVAESKTLTANSSASANITWKSSNTAVATVDSTGKVKAIKAGTATITASDGTATATCVITVRDHDYSKTSYKWNDTNKTCKVTYTCSYNSAHSVTYDCTMKSQVQEPATCSTMGKTRYIGTYANKTTYKDYRDIAIDKNAHGKLNLIGAVEATATSEGYTGDYICELCDAKVQTGTVIPRLTVGWQKEDGYWKYYDSESNAITGWKQISGKWYYFDTAGIMKTGWQKISNVWYYFEAGGAMVSGWKKISNVWYYFETSGAMAANKWVSYAGDWYYFGSDGAMLTSQWFASAGKWYYFGDDGVMFAGKWLLYKNSWYYFSTSGAMVTGKQTINGKTYTFNSSGVWLK